MFFEILFFSIHPRSLISSRNAIIIIIIIFLFENEYFTLSSSSSPSIYNIVISINTPTTMNNQFDLLMHQNFDFYSSYLITYAHKSHLFHLLFKFIQNPKILIPSFVSFIETLKLMILGH